MKGIIYVGWSQEKKKKKKLPRSKFLDSRFACRPYRTGALTSGLVHTRLSLERLRVLTVWGGSLGNGMLT